jgi:hypothetical protein
MIPSGFLVRGSIVAAIACLLAAGAPACTGQSAGSCYPGDRVSCTCDGGLQGFQTCAAAGQLGACACAMGGGGGATTSGSSSASSTSGSGGSGGADGGTDGGLLPFLSPCTTSAQCQTGLCFDFPAKGTHCTKACTTPTDCPPPSPGCNPQGVCRAP